MHTSLGYCKLITREWFTISIRNMDIIKRKNKEMFLIICKELSTFFVL